MKTIIALTTKGLLREIPQKKRRSSRQKRLEGALSRFVLCLIYGLGVIIAVVVVLFVIVLVSVALAFFPRELSRLAPGPRLELESRETRSPAHG